MIFFAYVEQIMQKTCQERVDDLDRTVKASAGKQLIETLTVDIHMLKEQLQRSTVKVGQMEIAQQTTPPPGMI